MSLKIHQVIYWTARALAALMAGLILVIFIGEAVSDGLGPLRDLTRRESLMMVAFVIVFLGLIFGWFWEILGGWLVVGGMLSFYLLDYLFSGSFPRGGTFFLIALPGLLYLFSGYSIPSRTKPD
jgi:hypothetical protein